MNNKNIKIGIITTLAFILMGFASVDYYISKNNKDFNFEYKDEAFSTFKEDQTFLRHQKLSSLLNDDENKSFILSVDKKKVDFGSMEKLKVINDMALDFINKKKGFPTKQDLNHISRIYNIPEELLYSIMMKESRGNPYAVSHKKARGAFQFMDETAKEFGLFKNGKDLRNNPWYSADAAARYIKWLFLYVTPEKDSKNLENYTYTLAAYNAGIARVKRGGGVYIPNIKETQDYVSKIMGHLKGEKYLVQLGDDLSKIAEKTHTTVKEIKRLNNNINDKQLRYGNFISIKSPYNDKDAYIVKKGDTLNKIANLTGVDLYTIRERNKLKGDIIYVGQKIQIP